jgi:N-acetyl-D-muramate 6-phosphate phosphatase
MSSPADPTVYVDPAFLSILRDQRAEIQGWFFDLDGTLMDTDNQAVDRLARRLRPLGAARAAHLARRIVMFGETPLNLAMTVFDVVGLDPVIFALRRRSSHIVEPTFQLVPKVTPLIEHLASLGEIAVVTTRSQEEAEIFLAQHGLAQYFSLITTQETTKRLKPHPEPIHYTAQKLGLPPSKCVMVGDTVVDIRSARRAGAWAVGVLCGFGERRELRRAGAHLVLDSTADLLTLLGEDG